MGMDRMGMIHNGNEHDENEYNGNDRECFMQAGILENIGIMGPHIM